jgi:hypothetical protein
MRITKLGWVLIALLVATVVLAIVAPTAGLIAAIVLAVILLTVLSQGFLGEGSQSQVHDAWAHVEVDRKRESLRR